MRFVGLFTARTKPVIRTVIDLGSCGNGQYWTCAILPFFADELGLLRPLRLEGPPGHEAVERGQITRLAVIHSDECRCRRIGVEPSLHKGAFLVEEVDVERRLYEGTSISSSIRLSLECGFSTPPGLKGSSSTSTQS